MVRLAAWALIGAGLVGVAVYLIEAFAPPSASSAHYNYPVGAEVYVAAQLLFGVQHLALAFGVLGLIWSGAVPPSSLGTPSAYAASGAVALLAVVQLVAIAAAGESRNEFFVDMLDESFGFISAAVALTLVLTGIAVAYAGRWRGPWRYLPLGLGIYVFFPLIPALTAPMGVARVVLAGWMVLFTLLGVGLLVQDRLPRPTRVTQRAGPSAVAAIPAEVDDVPREATRNGSDRSP
ncbi:MAG: hypothetical protein ABWY54_04805 [Glaciihabitans sp.]